MTKHFSQLAIVKAPFVVDEICYSAFAKDRRSVYFHEGHQEVCFWIQEHLSVGSVSMWLLSPNWSAVPRTGRLR
jgi:hypothetical protein